MNWSRVCGKRSIETQTAVRSFDLILIEGFRFLEFTKMPPWRRTEVPYLKSHGVLSCLPRASLGYISPIDAPTFSLVLILGHEHEVISGDPDARNPLPTKR